MTIELVKPSLSILEPYIEALRRGWSPDNVRGIAAAKEQLRKIEQDAEAFVGGLDDPNALGEPIALPDGSTVPRLPGFVRWIWDGDFAGSIGFRWQPGTSSLPSYVLGHVGYAVVPWKSGRGYATRALALLLPAVRERGLDYIELTTEPGNVASQKVILSNGGRLLGHFQKVAAYGEADALLFRIVL
jgi:predicted acetyltransferase